MAGVSQLELAPGLGPPPILYPLGQGTVPRGNAWIAGCAVGREDARRCGQGELNLQVAVWPQLLVAV